MRLKRLNETQIKKMEKTIIIMQIDISICALTYERDKVNWTTENN